MINSSRQANCGVLCLTMPVVCCDTIMCDTGRLVRVLRVFRIGNMKKFLAVLATTFRNSTTALSILLFFVMLLVILFAAITFIVEQGEFVVTSDFPEGTYVRWNYLKSEKEESPYKSILVSCYWAIVTTTTVGWVLPLLPCFQV